MLGFPLFERQSNRLIPTEEALILLEESEPLFPVAGRGEPACRRPARGPIGRGAHRLDRRDQRGGAARVIADYARQYPQIQISLETRPLHDSVLQVVENGLADVAFVISAYDRQSLDFDLVAVLRAVCICPQDHPLAQLESVTPRDLDGHPLIGPRTANRVGMMIAEGFNEAGREYQPSIETRFMNAAARIVGEGWGVAVVDELSAHTALRPGLTVRPFRSALQSGGATPRPRPRRGNASASSGLSPTG